MFTNHKYLIYTWCFQYVSRLFCTGIWNCRRLLKIQYIIAIHLMRWLTNFYDFRFKWTATAVIGMHPTKAWLSQLVNFKNTIWTWGHFRRTICNKSVLNLEKIPQKRMECFRLLLDRPSCMNRASVFEWHERFKEGKESVRDDERCSAKCIFLKFHTGRDRQEFCWCVYMFLSWSRLPLLLAN